MTMSTNPPICLRLDIHISIGFVFSKSGPQNQRIQYREFNADHPFLFMLIFEEEGNRTILLTGRVSNPALS
ncbi:hypothetical protein QE152_g14204 [Popillia japonica]|uniref:Serpin domain-containing protein n=1 Tax=Popillia japonica TaxID=7064 RepID=A0AAW1L7C2_POPJA